MILRKRFMDKVNGNLCIRSVKASFSFLLKICVHVRIIHNMRGEISENRSLSCRLR